MNAYSLQTYNLSVQLIEKIGIYEKVYLPLLDSKADCGQVWKVLFFVQKIVLNICKSIFSQLYRCSLRYNKLKSDKACGQLESANCKRDFEIQSTPITIVSTFFPQILPLVYLVSSYYCLQLFATYLAYFAFINLLIINICFVNCFELSYIQRFDYLLKHFCEPSYKGLRSRQYTLDSERTPRCPFSSG